MSSPLEHVAAMLGSEMGTSVVGKHVSGKQLEQKPLFTSRPTYSVHKAFKPPTAISAALLNTTSIGQLSTMGQSAVNSVIGFASGTGAAKPSTSYFEVLYRKRLNKKHNPYTEGILSLNGAVSTLMDASGKHVSKEFARGTGCSQIQIGAVFNVASYEAEIVSPIDSELFISGKVFLSGNVSRGPPTSANAAFVGSSVLPLRPTEALQYKPIGPKAAFKPLQPMGTELSAGAGASYTEAQPVSSTLVSFTRAPPSGMNMSMNRMPAPLKAKYDPLAPNALVVQQIGEAGALIPVVVDPYIVQHLRPHQRSGVQFLWECIVGVRGTPGDYGTVTGAILADDMGLGKTLQTIATVWTALKQSGTGSDRPLAAKVVIVTPSSLVGNWKKEFTKWLGADRCQPVAVIGQGKDAEASVQRFGLAASAVHNVLIISYEMARKYADLLAANSRIGLLVCDEGHRLKASGGSKTMTALAMIPTKRRILLTGTPVQNNLGEFYAMSSFACPGVLGALPSFKRNFEVPIGAGRDSSATPAEAELGAARATELALTTGSFVLRRTSEVLNKYLPPKTVSLVLCRASSLQARVYGAVATAYARTGISTRAVDTPSALLALIAMGKACAHPDLVHPSCVCVETGETAGSGGGAGAMQHARLVVQKIVRKDRSASVKVMENVCEGGEEEEMVGEEEEEEGEEEEEWEWKGASIVGLSALGKKAGRGHGRTLVIDSSDDEEQVRDKHARTSISTNSSAAAYARAAPAMPVLPLDFSSQRALLSGLGPAFPADYATGAFPLSSTLTAQSGVVSGALPALAPTQTASLLLSGKLHVLDVLLRTVRRLSPFDRVVLVSSFGAALDLMEGLCKARGWASLRLDGSTPAQDRTALVARFNAPTQSMADGTPSAGAPFVFLLSARAGGVGLNLIGANRLVLFDPNWNPAVDKQALARVWRDGQRKHVFIYRLLTAWTVEEKILQRQLAKEDLGVSVAAGGKPPTMAGNASSSQADLRFSRSDLVQLFSLDPGLEGAAKVYGCDTERMLAKAGRQAHARLDAAGGDMSGAGSLVAAPSIDDPTNPSLSSLWPPYSGPSSVQAHDTVLSSALSVLEEEGQRQGRVGMPPVSWVRTLLYNGKNSEMARTSVAAASVAHHSQAATVQEPELTDDGDEDMSLFQLKASGLRTS